MKTVTLRCQKKRPLEDSIPFREKLVLRSFAGVLKDGGWRRGRWSARIDAVKRPKELCKICGVAVVNVSERPGQVDAESLSFYC